MPAAFRMSPRMSIHTVLRSIAFECETMKASLGQKHSFGQFVVMIRTVPFGIAPSLLRHIMSRAFSTSNKALASSISRPAKRISSATNPMARNEEHVLDTVQSVYEVEGAAEHVHQRTCKFCLPCASFAEQD